MKAATQRAFTQRLCVALAVMLGLAFAFVQPGRAADDDGPDTVKNLRIPTDNSGNFVSISGSCRPKGETKPNAYLQLKWPAKGAARQGVEFTTGRILISGAKIMPGEVVLNELKKSTTDYVNFSNTGDAVEFATHTSIGVMRLGLNAGDKGFPSVQIQMKTAAGQTTMQFYLTPQGLSEEEPQPKPKRKPK